ncbi:MAG TPA: MBL fold metallo-hydrolase [Solirubrobacteraceae bacterium]|nr:MBL fold metallo-hydrolase [Solirubrobacteraceae bacterium]
MKVTVLGKSPSWQDVDGACSGYLVEDGDTSVLVDCGSGVFSKLRGVCDYLDVEAIVVTHMHPDHYFDLVPYACALTYGSRGHGGRRSDDRGPRSPRLLVPPDGAALLHTMAVAGGQPHLLDSAFEIAEYDIERPARIGGLDVRFQPVPHYVPANAIELRCAGGGRVTFGADHGPTDALDAFAAQTDLLFLEATLRVADDHEPRGHLTAAEAGDHAARCRARRLVLTHISDELDGARAVADAGRSFDGPVELAQEGAVYEV